MAVIPSSRPRPTSSPRPVRRTHRRTRPAAVPESRPAQKASSKPQARRRSKSRVDLGIYVVAATACFILAGLTFLLSSLLGHTMLRRSQAQYEDIRARGVFAERELTRLNKELRQINTLEGLGAMSQAHGLYRDGRAPIVAVKTEEVSNVPASQ